MGCKLPVIFSRVSHGVFAPNNKLHAPVTPTKQGKGNEAKACEERQEIMPAVDELGAARRHPHTEVDRFGKTFRFSHFRDVAVGERL